MSRTARFWRRLGRRGATTVEFAMVAPVFLMLVFLIVEGGRMLWTKQALQQAAFATVRCMALNVSTCDTDGERKTFAVAQAAKRGITITNAAVSSTTTTCAGEANSSRVEIQKPFSSPVRKLMGRVPPNVVASACLPKLTV